MKTNSFFIVFLIIFSFTQAQTTYYVDDDAVDDNGSGTSEATA